MPRFFWDEQTLRWFSDFSRFTGFHEKLAGLLRPDLRGCETLCDAGCGAGFVDLYLAAAWENILCVNRSEEGVAFYGARGAARRIDNLTAVAADCKEIREAGCGTLFLFSAPAAWSGSCPGAGA